MTKKTDLIEIRLDRRQTFYTVVGSLLIVSVVFVVGLIIGQRMQVPPLDTQAEPLPTIALSEPSIAPDADSVAPAEQESYTFYEELSTGTYQRPTVQLLPTVPQPDSQQPALQSLSRDPTQADTQHQASNQDTQATGGAPQVAAIAPSPAGEPPRDASTRTAAATLELPAAEPDGTPEGSPQQPETVANLSPQDRQTGSGPTRRLPRRTVRRLSSPEPSLELEDFGYYTVEVGVFSTFDDADQVRIQLREAGHAAIVTMIGDDLDEQRFRVQVGTFTRRSEAQAVADQVGDLGLSARVVQEG